MKKSAGALSVDDISSDVIIQQEATVISRWREVNEMKRRRAKESADGLALMTSSVTSSYSADGLREQSQESADALCVDNQSQATVDPDASNSSIQSRAYMNQLLLLNQSQALHISRLGSQTQEKKKQAKCRDSTSRELQNPVAREEDVAKLCNQVQSFQSTKISAEDEFSRSEKSAAKQLTTYEELSKLDVNC
ncbi:protein agamous-like 66 [Dorcoceras hygrometricum]|uniref:Protein agamous-like 66 n=1 Tax=Dorcoceras hygrometricum TaxID=472368 RepID=A0A2Z7BHC2_9LAMI|nr:protein agamous-like 66 [Dorcoceras hygrometricum]